MLLLEGLSIERVGEHHVVVIEDGQGHVRRVALFGMGKDVGRGRSHLGEFQDLLDRDAFPDSIQFRPARDAVDVRLDRLAGQGLELVPSQGERRIHLAVDLEVPFREVRVRYGSIVENRKLLGAVLARGDPFHDRRILDLVTEETLEHGASSVRLRHSLSSHRVTPS